MPLKTTKSNQTHHHGRSLLTTIDAFESSIEEKMVWSLYEQSHNKVILQYDNARLHLAKWMKTY